MTLDDLDFSIPDRLIATEPKRPSRVALIEGSQEPRKTLIPALLEAFQPGDLLVINNSKVVPARIFTDRGDEILFLKSADQLEWEVLFPSRGYQTGDVIPLPGGVNAKLTQKGLPQRVHTDKALERTYFEEHGELALPPYIQEARDERKNRPSDREWYQTAWAEQPGSVAAPTASLHFTNDDLNQLRNRGVDVETITLHVGAGTFLPIRTTNPLEHQMHGEEVFISRALAEKLKTKTGRVWALGTTATRALESLGHGLLTETDDGFSGESKLFIKPGHQFRHVDRLLTNFHQPRSTLILLVAAFAGLDRVKSVYQWAADQEFRFYSYGDLSAWIP